MAKKTDIKEEKYALPLREIKLDLRKTIIFSVFAILILIILKVTNINIF